MADTTEPIHTVLDSSSIASVTYDPENQLLEVVFRRTGHVYDYFDVPPDVYDALMEAPSKGAFLNQFIKPNYESIRVEFPM